jgi:hypothetical protein
VILKSTILPRKKLVPELEQPLRATLEFGGIRPKAPADLQHDSGFPDELFSFAAGLCRLVYRNSFDVESTLRDEGASCVATFGTLDAGLKMSSARAVAFVLDRRAWIGVRGTDELSD